MRIVKNTSLSILSLMFVVALAPQRLLAQAPDGPPPQRSDDRGSGGGGDDRRRPPPPPDDQGGGGDQRRPPPPRDGFGPDGPGGGGPGRGPGGFGPGGGGGPGSRMPPEMAIMQNYLSLVDQYYRLAKDPSAAGVAAVLAANDMLKGRGADAGIEYFNKLLPEVKNETVQRAIRIQLCDLYKKANQPDKALEQMKVLMTSADSAPATGAGTGTLTAPR